MITLQIKNYKENYNKLINILQQNLAIKVRLKRLQAEYQKAYNQLVQEVCTNSMTCDYIKYGTYQRCIKTPIGKVSLTIQRVFCKSNDTTHALLPESIVPYSQLLLKDHLSIIKASYKVPTDYEPIMASNPLIDENTITYIIKIFKTYWEERLLSFKIKLDNDITKHCFKYFNCQFCQIKNTVNSLI